MIAPHFHEYLHQYPHNTTLQPGHALPSKLRYVFKTYSEAYKSVVKSYLVLKTTRYHKVIGMSTSRIVGLSPDLTETFAVPAAGLLFAFPYLCYVVDLIAPVEPL